MQSPSAEPAAPSPRAWRTTFSILWVCQTGMFIAFQSSLPFIALYIQELGVPDQAGAAAWAGAINGVALAVYAIMNVIWGAVSDRWGLKSGLIRAQIFAAIGFLGAVLGTVLSGDRSSEEKFAELQVRANTGIGAEKAVSH